MTSSLAKGQASSGFVNRMQQAFQREWADGLAEEVREAAIQYVDSRLSEHFNDFSQKASRQMEEFAEESRKQTEEISKCIESFRKGQQDMEAENQKVSQLISQISALTCERVLPWMSIHTARSSAFPICPQFPLESISGSFIPRGQALSSPSMTSAASGDAGVPFRVPAQQISLADVLGIDKPDVNGFVFDVTLRVADGLELGVATTIDVENQVLRIDFVLPGGAVESWNRQCTTSNIKAERVLLPGDQIVSVNGIIGNAHAMLAECSSQALLRLRIIRKDGHRTEPRSFFKACSMSTASVSTAMGDGTSSEEHSTASPREFGSEAEF